MKYTDIVFVVTSWDKQLWNQLVARLLEMGVQSQDILQVNEKKSRSISLNKAWNTVIKNDKYKYIVFLDEDIWLPHNHTFERMRAILETKEVSGVIAQPKLVAEGQDWKTIAADLPVDTPWQNSLFDCTSNLLSLNCAMFDIALKQRFDEDLFGNQTLDTDFSWNFIRVGQKIAEDRALLVVARANNYFAKSLAYHTVVARNWHILKVKWQNIREWQGVEKFNKANEDHQIPSIEELTHWSETKTIQYAYKYNYDGLMRCYLGPRLSNIVSVGKYVQDLEQAIKGLPAGIEYAIPAPGALPVFKI